VGAEYWIRGGEMWQLVEQQSQWRAEQLAVEQQQALVA